MTLKINLCLFFLSVFVCPGKSQNETFRNPSETLDIRVNDLIKRLTLEEKVHQMMNSTPAIPRLGIPQYDYWNEALHGVARSGVATVFPQAIGLGATFDEELLLRISSAISDEARGMYNAAISKGYHQKYGGLTFWTPNINIFRDPRWGRGQETYGEDPYLTSIMGVAFVKGLQGDNPNYLKTAACGKHYVVHSGPERLRHEFNAIASPKDMYETYFPAFKALVEAGVESVMCAYNRTNDEPCCASNYLLDEVLRKEWGFNGHVVSDCGAIVDLYKDGHNVVSTPEEAAVMAVNSGVNLECGSVYKALLKAVEQSLISEDKIDSILAPVLKTRFKLGMFDPVGKNPYDAITSEVVNSDAHRKLAREAAVKSMVLLKNDGVLPLKNDLSKYFITGPNAASIEAMIGNYYGINPQITTIVEGIAAAIEPGSQLQYRKGVLLDRPNENKIDWTTPNAKVSDATFVVMGITGLLEGEEGAAIASPYFGDMMDYNLPQHQIDFLKEICRDNDYPVIAIVTGGSPMNLSEVHELADAVILAWYPGEEGGSALADIIFGKESPSGRLPVTFPKSIAQLPPYDDYSMEGRTYKYMKEEPLYPFGFGLSYTRFEYSNPALSSSKVKKNQSADVKVTVTNTGNVASDEVVQLYITDVKSSVRAPLYSLRGIQRVSLKPGESSVISFRVTPEMLSNISDEGKSVLESGEFKISVGGGLPGKRSRDLGLAEPAQLSLTVK